MRVLFVGDVVGKAGRRGLARALPGLRERFAADLVLANGENAADGVGITESTARELLDAGCDGLTLGNHAYRHREVYDFLDACERIVRPANYPYSNPGRGHMLLRAAGMSLCVINLSGTVGLDAARSPFSDSDALLERLASQADAFLVDFHAEVTSEKVAMGWHLDGRVGAVLGTHTHVPTADARVLPGGTAFISDVGMTGSRDGVLGARRDQALERFRTMMPVRLESAKGNAWVNAVVVEIGEGGLASSIGQILEPAEE